MSTRVFLGWLAVGLAGGLSGCDPPLLGDEAASEAVQSVGNALGESDDSDRYARALAPRTFAFPADHGPHPDYRNEWWYFTGNLETSSRRRFGYQLTFFRIALSPEALASESRWRTRQLYMAHFALSDLDAGEFHAFERFSRGAAGLAGAENPPLRVWLDHWSAAAEGGPGFPLRLQAAEEGVAIDLTLVPAKPVVLNGDGGLSRKSAEPGNASYYYSMTRLVTDGTVVVRDNRFEVKGTTWLDREWSTSALAANQSGWDWFALQLDDGRDLMIYRMRLKDGRVDPASTGTLVEAEGHAIPLVRDDIDFAVRSHWTSPASGVRYPARWTLALPGRDLELDVEPLMADQELDLTVRYWEGAVRVSGRDNGRKVSGRGYMELAGYGDEG